MFKKSHPGVEVSKQLIPSVSWQRRLALFGQGKQKDYFVENFAMLVAAGMDLVSALDALEKGVSSRTIKKLIIEMKADIEAGATLSATLAGTGWFAPHIIALVRTGEEAGTLVNNLAVIVEEQRKDSSFKSKLRSASMYPLFVLGLAFVLGLGIAWFILPRLSSVFVGLNVKLPLITRLLIQVGEFMRIYGATAVPLIILAVMVMGYVIFVWTKTNFIGHWLLFHFPGVSRLLQEVELARFGYILGTLLQAGLPATVALTTLADASTFRRYQRFYRHLKERVEEGDSLQEAFVRFRHSGKLIPVPIQQMIIAGQQSGRLAKTILDIGAIFEDKTETTTKNIAVVLEPILLVIVWLGVVAVALSVILPIYSLIGGLGRSNVDVAPTQQSVTSPELPLAGAAPLSQTVTSSVSSTSVQPSALIHSEALGRLEVTPFGAPEANIRKQPSLQAPLLTKVLAGGKYFYTEVQQKWYHVVLSSTSTGWIYFKNIKEIK